MDQVVVARRSRRHRGGVDLAIAQHRQHLVLEQAGHQLGAALAELHGGDRAGEDADLAVRRGEVVERADRHVVAAHGDRNAAAAIGLRYPQARFRLGLAVGDAVHDDVAVGAEDIVAGDDPVLRQRHAEPARKGLGELHLEAVPATILAGEGQRVGMGAQHDGAAVLDLGQGARYSRAAGEQHEGEEGGEAGGGASGGHGRVPSVALEMADVVDDAFDLRLAERALEGRHRAFLALLDAVGDEGIAALGVRELGPFPGLAPAILVAPAAGGGEEFVHLRVAHRLLFAGGKGGRSDQACGEDARGDNFIWHRSSNSKGRGNGLPRPFQRLPTGYFSA